MNNHRPLLWVAAVTQERFKAAIYARLVSWAGAWGLPSPAEPEVTDTLPTEPGSLDLAEPTADSTGPWRDRLALAVLGSGVQGSALAESVIQDCHNQFRAALLPPELPARGPAAAGEPGHLGLTLRAEVLGSAWHVTWSSEALLAAGVIVRPALPPLPAWQPESSLSALPVPMRAVVGTADVDVLGLLNLAPGDVIVLYQRLDDPIAVWGLDSALRLSAHLGSTEGQVAVQWLPTPR